MINLKEYRLKFKLTQEQLAKKINMSYQAIATYEKGTREPDIQTIIKLSEIFNISTDELLGKTQTEDGITYPQRFVEVNDEEKELVNSYKNLSINGKTYIKQMIKFIISEEKEEKQQNKKI